jgi:hypothetical protein
MTIFEVEEDLRREQVAIKKFVDMFGGSFQKLDQFDIDYKVFDKDKNLIAYAEVKGRIRTMDKAYPLPIAVRKIMKLSEKRLNPVLIWACEDGIIYAKLNELVGQIKFSGRTPRAKSTNDMEIMAYYEKQKCLKYVRF